MTYPPDPQQPYGSPESALPPPPSYGQAPQAPYGQAPYGQAPYGQAPYGQVPYGQPAFGQPPYGQLPPKKKSNGGVIALVVIGGVLALCLVLGVVGAIALSGSDSGTATTSSGGGRDGGSAPGGALNQPVRDGNAEFTVSSVKCGVTSVGKQYSTKTPKQGQFCVVTATVKNVGDAPLGLEASSNEALDASGQEFRADISATIAANEDVTLFLKDLDPGTSTPVTWVWDLPAGERITTLKLYESFSSKGVDVAVP